jgi:hypothetical protein
VRRLPERLLAGEAQPQQQMPDVAARVRDAEELLDPPGHPPQLSQLGTKRQLGCRRHALGEQLAPLEPTVFRSVEIPRVRRAFSGSRRYPERRAAHQCG